MVIIDITHIFSIAPSGMEPRVSPLTPLFALYEMGISKAILGTFPPILEV